MKLNIKTTKGLGSAAAVSLLLGLAGCGEDTASGAADKLNGEPIVIAEISDTSGAGSISAVIAQFTEAEKAAVEYVNTELGGIGGRPIELFVCDSKVDPAATSSCAQQAIDKGAVAKVGLSVLWGENGIPLFEKAGIPSMNAPVSAQDSTNAKISFPLGGGAGTEWPAQISYWAKNFGMKKAVILADDNSTGRVQIENQEAIAESLGVEIVPVFLPVGAADPTPYVAKAVQEDPDVIFTAASGAAAVAVYRALNQQGYPADKIVNQGAAVDEETFFSKVPAELIEGSYYTYEFDSYDDLSNPDVKQYREAMKKYGPNEGKSEFYQWGFSDVMTIAKIADKVGTKDFDADALRQFLLTVEDFKAFMGGNLSRKDAPESAPASIQSGIRIMQYKNGKVAQITDGYYYPFAGN